MTDLFEQPSRPTRLTLAQQALVNFMGCWALQVFAEKRATDQCLIVEWLPKARKDVPQSFDDVLQAADHIADCHNRQLPLGHVDWWDAHIRTNQALEAFYSRRGVAAARAHETAEAELHPQQKDAADAVA